jgi:flagellar biosynthesis/type III secretory pathway ATPase
MAVPSPQRGGKTMKALAEQIVDIDGVEIYGRVVSVRGLMVEVAGPIHAMSVGARLTIETGTAKIPCEVVGFSRGHALAMPFAALDGVRRGCRAVITTLPAPFAHPSAGSAAWSMHGRTPNHYGGRLSTFRANSTGRRNTKLTLLGHSWTEWSRTWDARPRRHRQAAAAYSGLRGVSSR